MNTSPPGGWGENGAGQKRGSSVCKCICVFPLGYLVEYLKSRERSHALRPSFSYQHYHLSFQHSSPGVVSLVLQMKLKPGGLGSLGNPVSTQPSSL